MLHIMRPGQVTLASFKKRRRLLLLFTWTLFSCCLLHGYQTVEAIQRDPKNSPTKLYAPLRAQQSPVMNNLRRQMDRIHSSPYQRRRSQPKGASPRSSQVKKPSPSSLDTSHVIIEPQLTNVQSVANIKLRLSLMEKQIKEIHALLDGLVPSPEKTFKLSAVASVASKLKPNSNMNPLQLDSSKGIGLGNQPNQEVRQNNIQSLTTSGIVSDQEGVSTPVVARIGSRPTVGEFEPQDPVYANSGSHGDREGGVPQVASTQVQLTGESEQFSGSQPYHVGLGRLSDATRENEPYSNSILEPSNLPLAVEPQQSSSSKASQTSSEISPVPIAAGIEQSQNHQKRMRDTNLKQEALGQEGQERGNQKLTLTNFHQPSVSDSRSSLPQDDVHMYNQEYQQHSGQDDLRRDMNRPVEMRIGDSSVRSYEGGRNEQYQVDNSNNNMHWDNQEENHEYDQFNQRMGEEYELEQQRGGGRKRRKKHRLREAVIKGAKIAKDVATVGLHKAQQYSPVVDVVARKVQEHLVPVVNEAFMDGKEVVHGMSQGIERSRRRRKSHKRSRKLNRTVSVVSNDGAQADMNLERAVPDMLGAYPNIPPEV